MASSDSTSTIKTLMCYCGKKACRRTSWTNNNPGRRFHGCGDVASGCGFFVWEDPPMCTRAKKIILGLLYKLNKIAKEFSEMRNKRDPSSAAAKEFILIKADVVQGGCRHFS
ncbi:UNVERIFIED_CONTAM: hypothetical protein Scaly_2860400 [Sesamum calycinum]|uniref:GRF-type domain-containing protein n=1 Tax=Sesamum calycinum TaxID=2727403 RepID=A0AAW2LKB1_9LAMI